MQKIISRQEALFNNLKHYFTGKCCHKGHLSPRFTSSKACIKCEQEKSTVSKDELKAYRNKYYRENKDRIQKVNKAYADVNKNNKAVKAKDYYNKNREVLLADKKHYNRVNKSAIRERRKYRELVRRKEDPIFVVTNRIRTRIKRAFREAGYKKNSATENMIGCSWAQLKQHIENQFLEGMNWGNRNLWHIDHIIPLASAKSIDELVRLNHYKNLRPLWAFDNLSKGAKMI